MNPINLNGLLFCRDKNIDALELRSDSASKISRRIFDRIGGCNINRNEYIT